jgi:hypothetical protein
MANTDYTQELQRVIFRLHRVDAVHLKSVPVSDETVWQETVEVFQLTYHPDALHCYAWTSMAGKEPQVMTALEIPPIESAESAVALSRVAT